MFKKIAVAAMALLIATPVLASSCPKHMKAIDDALAKNPKLTEAQMSEVKKLRADGEAHHKAGRHGESEAALRKAEDILGIK